MDAPAASEVVTSRAARIANALGTAWNVFNLYPDPAAQPAFLRAVDELSEPTAAGIPIHVHAGTFAAADEDLSDVRDSAKRFARQLFVCEIETITWTGPPTPEGLVAWFRLLESAGDSGDDNATLVAKMVGTPGTGFEIDARGLLEGMAHIAEETEVDDEVVFTGDGVAFEAYRGSPPNELAAFLLSSEGDEQALADKYTAGFGELFDELLPAAAKSQAVLGSIDGGNDDPWKAVRNLIEAFFYLPRPIQIGVLETVLADTDDERHQVFLDQFSGLDLVEFLEDLSDGATKSLLEYAVAAAGSREGAPAELLETLQSAKEVQDSRKALANRISELLRHSDERLADDRLLAGLRERLHDMPEPFEMTRAVLRGLLECEQREDRFERVLRLWTGRIAAAIRSDDLDRARELLAMVLEDPPYAEAMEPYVRGAIRRLAGPELLRSLAEHEHTGELSQQVIDLIQVFGGAVVDELVRQLAEEEDGQMRKVLIEMLVVATSSRPRALEPYLGDKRWYVVRNLAVVLGRTGRGTAVPLVRSLLDHEDDRVRIEAMRSLVRLMRAEAAPVLVTMMGDTNAKVRRNAVALLKAADIPNVEEVVGEALSADGIEPDVANALVGFLAERRTPEAMAVIERLGSRLFVVKGSQRVVRDAARRILKGAR